MGDDDVAKENVASFLTPLAAVDDFTFANLLTYAWTKDRLDKLAKPSIGGPLYPPINAFVYYPLGQLSPRWGYHAMQIMHTVLALVAGLGVCRLSRGRIWWPIAVMAIIGFPGFLGSIDLAAEFDSDSDHPDLGLGAHGRRAPRWRRDRLGITRLQAGVGAGLFPCPRGLQRWRFCLAMSCTGILMAAVTLPAVGWHRLARLVEHRPGGQRALQDRQQLDPAKPRPARHSAPWHDGEAAGQG